MKIPRNQRLLHLALHRFLDSYRASEDKDRRKALTFALEAHTYLTQLPTEISSLSYNDLLNAEDA